MISLYVSNISEDVWPFIQGISDPKARQDEIDENATLSDRDLFTASFNSQFAIITPLPISQSFVNYYHQLFPNKLIAAFHPANHSGQTFLDIINDPQLISQIKNLSLQHDGIQLFSYSSSAQFYQLYRHLKKQGIKVHISQAPKPQSRWIVDFLGSKAGIRQSVDLVSSSTVKCPYGCIANNLSIALNLAKHVYTSNNGVVIKTNKGHSGAGVLLFPRNSDQQAFPASTIRKAFAADKYWRKNNVVVEDFIDIDMNIGGGSPSIEFLIDDDSKVNYLYLGGMRVTKEGVFRGMEIGHQVIPDNYSQQMIEVGHKIANLYASLGYIGYFDIDFIVDKNGTLFITESNVRKTGGTHAYILATQIFGPNFSDQTFVLSNNGQHLTHQHDFNHTHQLLKPLLFDPKTKTGLIIISQNLLSISQFAYVIFAPDKKQALSIEEQAIKLLS